MLSGEQVAELRQDASGRNRIGCAKRLAKLTQVEIAERTGYTQSFISKIENGQYVDLPGETMRTFAGLFGCAIEDLFPRRHEEEVA